MTIIEEATRKVAKADLVLRILTLLAEADAHSYFFWDSNDGEFRFYIRCDDTFALAAADAEEVTADNIAILERSMKDVQASVANDLEGFYEWHWGAILFCARMRKQLPVEIVPRDLRANPKIWALFEHAAMTTCPDCEGDGYVSDPSACGDIEHCCPTVDCSTCNASGSVNVGIG